MREPSCAAIPRASPFSKSWRSTIWSCGRPGASEPEAALTTDGVPLTDRVLCDVALAGAALTRGDQQKAAELLTRHRAEATGHWLFESVDARLLAARGQAGPALEKVTRFEPEEVGFEPLLFAAQLQCEVGDAEACLATLARARGLTPRGRAAGMSFESARLFARLGRKDLARSAIRDALDRSPDGVRTRLVAARLLVRTGHVLDAATMLPPLLQAAWRWVRRG